MTITLRRRIIGLLVAIVVVASCIFLGRWQWHRHVDRKADVAEIEANYDQSIEDFSNLVPEPSTQVPQSSQWRPVVLNGHYGDKSITIRNRPLEGNPGYHVAAPFYTDTGIVLVNRGFLAHDKEGEPHIPAPPEGELNLTARIRPAEPADSRQAPAGQGFTFNPDQLLADEVSRGQTIYTGTYLVASAENGAPVADNLTPIPRPDTDLGSHLSYAFQWWFFAGGAVVAFVILIRRENEHEEHNGPNKSVEHQAHPGKKTRKKRSSSTAEEEEDALIAAWENQNKNRS